MAISRYIKTTVLGVTRQYGTGSAVDALRQALASGLLRYDTVTLAHGVRLDVLAGKHYGSGDLWWAIAAASNIGWGLQVPAGTLIRIPNPDDIVKFLG